MIFARPGYRPRRSRKYLNFLAHDKECFDISIEKSNEENMLEDKPRIQSEDDGLNRSFGGHRGSQGSAGERPAGCSAVSDWHSDFRSVEIKGQKIPLIFGEPVSGEIDLLKKSRWLFKKTFGHFRHALGQPKCWRLETLKCPWPGVPGRLATAHDARRHSTKVGVRSSARAATSVTVLSPETQCWDGRSKRFARRIRRRRPRAGARKVNSANITLGKRRRRPVRQCRDLHPSTLSGRPRRSGQRRSPHPPVPSRHSTRLVLSLAVASGRYRDLGQPHDPALRG